MAPIRLYNLASLADHATGSSPIILRLLPPWYWAGRRAPLFTLSLSMFYVLFPFFTDQAKTCSLASGLLMHTQCHLPHYSPFSMFFSYMQKFPPALSFQVSLFFFPSLFNNQVQICQRLIGLGMHTAKIISLRPYNSTCHARYASLMAIPLWPGNHAISKRLYW